MRNRRVKPSRISNINLRCKMRRQVTCSERFSFQEVRCNGHNKGPNSLISETFRSEWEYHKNHEVYARIASLRYSGGTCRDSQDYTSVSPYQQAILMAPKTA